MARPLCLALAPFALAVLALPALAGCSKSPAGAARADATDESSSASAPTLPKDASADANADAMAAEAGVDGGAHHILVLRWQVAKTGPANLAKVAVTLRAGAATIPVGELDATNDDPSSGTPKACSLKKTSSTASSFTCGGVPAYNFFTATLKDGTLIVTRTTGVDGEKGSEKNTEVKRVPVTETALRTLAFKPAAAKASRPKCPKGQIASDATGDWRCTQMCTSDAECKAGFFCDLQRDTTPDGRMGAVLESACEEEK